MEVLIHAMKDGTDDQSTTLLAKLHLGYNVKTLAVAHTRVTGVKGAAASADADPVENSAAARSAV